MNKRSLILALTLALLSSGCSDYKAAALGPQDDPTRPALTLQVGDDARIQTTAGEIFTGEVSEITPTAITLQNPGNYGTRETTIPKVEIVEAEVRRSMQGGRLGLGDHLTAVFLGFSVLAIAILIRMEPWPQS